MPDPRTGTFNPTVGPESHGSACLLDAALHDLPGPNGSSLYAGFSEPWSLDLSPSLGPQTQRVTRNPSRSVPKAPKHMGFVVSVFINFFWGGVYKGEGLEHFCYSWGSLRLPDLSVFVVTTNPTTYYDSGFQTLDQGMMPSPVQHRFTSRAPIMKPSTLNPEAEILEFYYFHVYHYCHCHSYHHWNSLITLSWRRFKPSLETFFQ